MIEQEQRSNVPEKIPAMSKNEYDDLVRNGTVARIAFSGAKYPYIAPFMYVFDGRNMYFLSTRYGRKMSLFAENPAVSVEVEEIASDISVTRTTRRTDDAVDQT